MLVTEGLQSVLAQSPYRQAPNAGSYASPSIVGNDPAPSMAGDAWSPGTGTTMGMGVGKVSLCMLALVIVGLVAFAYWVKPISA